MIRGGAAGAHRDAAVTRQPHRPHDGRAGLAHGGAVSLRSAPSVGGAAAAAAPDPGLAWADFYRQRGRRGHPRPLPGRQPLDGRPGGGLRDAPARAPDAGYGRRMAGDARGRHAEGSAGRGKGGRVGVTTAPERLVNNVTMEFPAEPDNVAFARTAAAMFASRLDFTLDELDEIKVAVSEAVTNCILHAYPERTGWVRMELAVRDGSFHVTVADDGVGMADPGEFLPAGVTSRPGDCLGLGFTLMAEYMDTLAVDSSPGGGTRVRMSKRPAPPSQGGLGAGAASWRKAAGAEA